MKILWDISDEDSERIRAFVKNSRRNPFVVRRFDRNVRGNRNKLTKGNVWKVAATCLLSTQQRSGPNSAVQRFMREKPFPISYRLICKREHQERFIAKRLRVFGGLRRCDTIARELVANMPWFEGKDWGDFRHRLQILTEARGYRREREVAEWVRQTLRGFGPKQSRNLLQALGLTRYEIPIDSRIVKWLNDFGFPIHLQAQGLGDPDYYNFIMDGVRELCRAGKVHPCILDAAIFASFDRDAWDGTPILW